MERESDRFALLSRRALLLGGLQAAVTSVLVGRLGYLQVLKGSQYKLMSEENRISFRILSPPRGQILDRFGVPLALNQQSFQALITPDETKDLESVLNNLTNILGLTEQDSKRILRDIKRSRVYIPVTVRENLTQEQADKLEVNKPDLPGVSVESGPIRQYPLGDSTAHVIGYVGAVSEEEVASGGTNNPLLTVPGYKIGKIGIEKAADKMLSGQAGYVQMEVNAAGRAVRKLSETEPVAGKALTLTLDAELQHYVQERLSAERSAAAVIMDAQSGAVYALASFPAYDPNQFSSSIPLDVWQQLQEDETNPLTNKAIAGQYPPGSTFKIITALAALENNIITPETRCFCPGYVELGTHRFHCWKKEGHGSLNLKGALAQSCDVFFYEAGRKTGIEKLGAMARRFGLGAKTNLDMPGEKPGFVPTPAWKKKRFKETWQLGETLVNSIGQGYMLATPLQLAVMTARLVNGGYGVEPYLIETVEGKGSKRSVPPSLGIAAQNMRAVMDGLLAVTSPGGTASAAQIKEPGFQMAGKTGTSQVRRISMAERAAGFDVNKLAWQFRHHALFVGYAPFDNPRYIASVIVEHGASGAGAAAPLTRDILLRAQQRDLKAKIS